MDRDSAPIVLRPFAWNRLCYQSKQFEADTILACDRLLRARRYLDAMKNGAVGAPTPNWLGPPPVARLVADSFGHVCDRELSFEQRELVKTVCNLICDRSVTTNKSLEMLRRFRGALRSRRVVSRRADGSVSLIYLPPENVLDELAALCLIGKCPTGLPPLQRIIGAFAHFIAIHPFMDGNGRSARLLVTELLKRMELWGDTSLPFSFLMYRDRARHLSTLYPVLTEGDWTTFVPYALQWISAAAELAVIIPRKHTQQCSSSSGYQ